MRRGDPWEGPYSGSQQSHPLLATRHTRRTHQAPSPPAEPHTAHNTRLITDRHGRHIRARAHSVARPEPHLGRRAGGAAHSPGDDPRTRTRSTRIATSRGPRPCAHGPQQRSGPNTLLSLAGGRGSRVVVIVSRARGHGASGAAPRGVRAPRAPPPPLPVHIHIHTHAYTHPQDTHKTLGRTRTVRRGRACSPAAGGARIVVLDTGCQSGQRARGDHGDWGRGGACCLKPELERLMSGPHRGPGTTRSSTRPAHRDGIHRWAHTCVRADVQMYGCTDVRIYRYTGSRPRSHVFHLGLRPRARSLRRGRARSTRVPGAQHWCALCAPM
ncbi:hypothetical protein BC628DRAFT_378744 [Trametes gibbosa]|nr:hypothetical protein BC628DRAFT_378744 [Trametes gibbosa]